MAEGKMARHSCNFWMWEICSGVGCIPPKKLYPNEPIECWSRWTSSTSSSTEHPSNLKLEHVLEWLHLKWKHSGINYLFHEAQARGWPVSREECKTCVLLWTVSCPFGTPGKPSPALERSKRFVGGLAGWLLFLLSDLKSKFVSALIFQAGATDLDTPSQGK